MIARRNKLAGGAAKASTGLWPVYGVGLIVCVGLSAATYLLGVQPALASRTADEAYAADIQGRRQNAADLAVKLTATRQKLEQTRREVAGLSLRLEPATDVNQRLAKLADLATAAGLEINEVQPGAAADSPHYQVVPIRISGTGTYPASAQFLHQLREKYPDTAARSIEIANPSPTRDHTAGTFRFELMWYTAPAGLKGGRE
jgi:Tfp pilus assembly protein PilO